MATLCLMPRRARLEGPGVIHHVVAKAANGANVVTDDADRLRFLDELRTVVSTHGWLCIAYCVMDTHVHLVICTPEPNLGQGMKLLLGRYAITFNRRLDRHGYVFTRPFWSRRVDKPHYLRCAVALRGLESRGRRDLSATLPPSGGRAIAGRLARPRRPGCSIPGSCSVSFDEDEDRARVVLPRRCRRCRRSARRSTSGGRMVESC